jgi:hypothetical protein
MELVSLEVASSVLRLLNQNIPNRTPVVLILIGIGERTEGVLNE